MTGSEFESLLELYESRIGWMTILVVVGVLGEVLVEAIRHGRDRPWREWAVPAFWVPLWWSELQASTGTGGALKKYRDG